MNLLKKVIGAGTSAALVASLLATAAVPAALADTSVANTVAVPVGGTSSGTALALTFNDASTKTGTILTTGTTTGFCAVTTDGTTTGTLTYTIRDYAGGSTLHFTGTPTFAPGVPSSLIASVALAQTVIANDSFTVTIAGCDPNNVEQFTVTGLQIAASSSAATGTIQGNLSGTSGFVAAVTGTTTTATGTLQAAIVNSLAQTLVSVNVTSTCPFVVGPAGLATTANFADISDARSITAVSAVVGNIQQVSFGAGLYGHAITTVVTQTVPACSVFASPGTVGSVATQNAVLQTSTQQQVNPGQQNQLAGTTTLAEPSAGFLALNSTATFKISAAGVLFSHAPTATVNGSAALLAAPTLSANVLTGPQPLAASVGTVAAGTYYFQVTAKGLTSGETTPSNVVTAVVGAAGGAITLGWTAVSGSFGGYNVYESSFLAGPYTQLTLPAINPVAGNSVTISTPITAGGAAVPTINNAVPAILAPTGLVQSVALNTVAGPTGAVAAASYYFVATAITAAGETTPSSVLTAPVTAPQAGLGATLVISWPVVTGATGYYLYQALSPVGPFVQPVAAAITGTSVTFVATPVPSGAVQPPTTNTALGLVTGALVLGSSLCTLSLDRTSCTVTVSTASTAAATITLSNIYLDVASTVPYGTAVNLVLTTSPVVTLSVTANTIAYVAQALLAVSVQAVPTVYIDYNAQPSGVITASESQPGFFQAGSSGNNVLTLCITDQGTPWSTFTFAPFAVVRTGGDLLLLNSSTHLGVTSIAGTVNGAPLVINSVSRPAGTCAQWTVFSASTKASTIDIVGADASGALSASVPTNGPTLSVSPSAIVGPVVMTVTSGGSGAAAPLYSKQVTNAVRAFKSGVTVTAVTQPYVAPGTTSAAGNVNIAETLNGQLLAGEQITCTVLPNPLNESQQTYLSTANANNLPVVTTGGGLLAYLVGTTSTSFTVGVTQQAYAPSFGSINVANLWFTTISGATNGPVTLECMNGTQFTGSTVVFGTIGIQPDATTGTTTSTGFHSCFDITGSGFVPGIATIDAGTGTAESVSLVANAACTPLTGHQQFSVFVVTNHVIGAPITETIGTGSTFMTGTAFDQFVSNAIVGTAPAAGVVAVTTSGTALGATKVGPFTVATKVAKLGKYVTWKFSGGSALVGKTVQIWVATKNAAGKWSAFALLTARRVDASGNAYFWWKTSSKAWISVRGGYLTTLSVATQARWL